jgi:hypothetical protein
VAFWQIRDRDLVFESCLLAEFKLKVVSQWREKLTHAICDVDVIDWR